MAIRPFEFWHPRIFEAPYYVYLLARCAWRRLPIKYLAKANYALDHGELGLGSKQSTQMAFDQSRFLPSILLEPSDPDRTNQARTFADQFDYPVILKPDIGAVGKGIEKLNTASELVTAVEALQCASVLQQFTSANVEYGVFFCRSQGVGRITGINKKHFPTVTGNGRDSIATLASQHPRFTSHWELFLKYWDTNLVPAKDEQMQLSFIGSHTMGCMFTEDSHLLTPALTQALNEICDSQPGFNFGRLDVKAVDLEAFQAGEFVVIEVNGIASLPTHMFDPSHSLKRAYQIFFQHGKLLVDIAAENRDQPMQLSSYSELWQRAKANNTLLNAVHNKAIGLG